MHHHRIIHKKSKIGLLQKILLGWLGKFKLSRSPDLNPMDSFIFFCLFALVIMKSKVYYLTLINSGNEFYIRLSKNFGNKDNLTHAFI